MKARICTLAALLLLLGADQSTESTLKKDIARIQGHWNFAGIEVNGGKISDKDLKERAESVYWTFSRDRVTFNLGGETSSGTYRLLVDRNPREIYIRDAFAKGVTVQGIYAFEGDKLKICIGKKDGRDRPASFAAKKDTGHVNYVMQRSRGTAADGTSP